jgi:hypothetical protein
MKKVLALFSVLILFSCSNSNEIEILKETFEGDWPFTVESGTLGCDKSMIYFTTNGKTYGINGISKKTYPEPDEIWADNPDIPGLKISIGDVVNKGMELCE